MALLLIYHWPELVTGFNLTAGKSGRSPSMLRKERIMDNSQHQQPLPAFSAHIATKDRGGGE